MGHLLMFLLGSSCEGFLGTAVPQARVDGYAEAKDSGVPLQPDAGADIGSGDAGVSPPSSTPQSDLQIELDFLKNTPAPTVSGTGCSDPAPMLRRTRPLTRTEIANTLADVFPGLNLARVNFLTEEVIIGGFSNTSDAMSFGDSNVDKLYEIAQFVTDFAVQNVGRLTKLPACNGSLSDTCAKAALLQWTSLLWREIPGATLDQRVRLGYDDFKARLGTSASAFRFSLFAVLMSPRFLYVQEDVEAGPGSVSLSCKALVTNLALILWASLPDQMLLEASRQPAFLSPVGLRTTIESMVNDQRFYRGFGRFVGDWLDTRELPTLTRNANIFKGYNADIGFRMVAETTAFSVNLVRRAQPFSSMFQQKTTFVDAKLASYYGLVLPTQAYSGIDPSQFVEVNYTDPAVRGGLLTLGAFLTCYAHEDSTSPIHRGEAVRERLLCQSIPPPPPTLNVMVPPPSPKMTTRQRFTAHTASPACASCHAGIDPIGFAFENFSGAGLWRAAENSMPIDSSGALVGTTSSDGPVMGVGALATKLSSAAESQTCFTRQLGSYALARVLRAQDACLLRSLETPLGTSNASIRELLIQTLLNESFRQRTAEP
jgi:Protein of unknown function (DUF1588)/Protein of unknown function (DUF1592)/Protein of unknown function (DUF1585)/Protein of unknown function (DUF1587)